MALDIVLSFIGTCKVICLSKGQSSPYDQLSRILPLLGKKRATPTTASPPVWELGLIYYNILVLGWGKMRHAHTSSHFRLFLRVSHNAAQFYLGTIGVVIQNGWRWQLWILSVWCHSLSLSGPVKGRAFYVWCPCFLLPLNTAITPPFMFL